MHGSHASVSLWAAGGQGAPARTTKLRLGSARRAPAKPIRFFALLFLVLVTGLCFVPIDRGARAEGAAEAPDRAANREPGLFDATSTHGFGNVAHWVSVFDDPKRDVWQKPEQVVEALELRPGARVVDLGAGTGYFSRHLATAVGESGTVFAVEVEPNLVVHLRERAENEKTPNVIPILASLDNPRLPRAVVDLVLIVDTFHHIDDRLGYLRRLRSALTPGGRVAIIDWLKRELPVGPDVDHKIPRQQVIREMEKAGYRLTQAPDLLPYQYFLIFEPVDGSHE